MDGWEYVDLGDTCRIGGNRRGDQEDSQKKLRTQSRLLPSPFGRGVGAWVLPRSRTGDMANSLTPALHPEGEG